MTAPLDGNRSLSNPAEPEVRLAKRGLIVFNKAAMDRLGGDQVQLLHDPTARMIAFRVALLGPNAYKVQRNGNTGQVVATAFSRHIGHDRLTITRYPATWSDHMLIVSLDNPMP